MDEQILVQELVMLPHALARVQPARVQTELRLEWLKRLKLELSRPCRFSLFHRHVAKNLQQFQPTTSDNWILIPE